MPRIKIGWLLAVLLWAAGIWILSNIPDLNSGLEQDFILRKIAHAAEFGVLAFLIYKALTGSKISHVLLAGLLALTYAGLDELHQSYVFGRVGATTDVLIDSIGIVLVVALLIWRVRQRPLRGLAHVDQIGHHKR